MKGTIGSIDLTGVVPLKITGSPIPEIDCFPEGVVSRIKCTTIGIELIGKYENVILIVEASACFGRVRCFGVDELGYGKGRGRNGDGVASGLVEKEIVSVAVYIGDDGVCNEEGEEGENEEDEDTDVENATGSEKGGGFVDRVRLVEEIFFVRSRLVVYRGVVDIRDEAASHGWWTRGIF